MRPRWTEGRSGRDDGKRGGGGRGRGEGGKHNAEAEGGERILTSAMMRIQLVGATGQNGVRDGRYIKRFLRVSATFRFLTAVQVSQQVSQGPVLGTQLCTPARPKRWSWMKRRGCACNGCN